MCVDGVFTVADAAEPFIQGHSVADHGGAAPADDGHVAGSSTSHRAGGAMDAEEDPMQVEAGGADTAVGTVVPGTKCLACVRTNMWVVALQPCMARPAACGAYHQCFSEGQVRVCTRLDRR